MDNPLNRVVQPVARLAAVLCGYGILILSFAIGVEVIGRKFFAFSLQGVDDFGGFMLAIAAAVGACYTLAHRGHTRIDVFLLRMSPRWQAILNLAAMLTFAVFAGFAFWQSVSVWRESRLFMSVSDGPLQTPLVYPQGAWVFGLFLMAVFAAAYAVHAAVLFARNPGLLNKIYGPATVDEEVEAELDARRQREGTP
ncbi:TRAP transporter small permease subunit [Prosthecomicrobium sp. N25]|uniref:TRAP transporter small permease subunit n=1 Tax=Prosthecomicrobium sp. N25 TaxID=3129254 RepID=UPI003077F281